MDATTLLVVKICFVFLLSYATPLLGGLIYRGQSISGWHFAFFAFSLTGIITTFFLV